MSRTFNDRAVAGSRTLVWVRGEYDIATESALSETLARGTARDACGLVVDLSVVEARKRPLWVPPSAPRTAPGTTADAPSAQTDYFAG